ncbi:MAG: hypothetical protein U5L96_02135 [Owenweeksia sp.]|nr:hypothetical protein [Owenweeksia sp.]
MCLVFFFTAGTMTALAQRSGSYEKDIFWAHLGMGYHSFNSGQPGLGLGVHYSWGRNLLSLQGSGNLEVEIFCPQGLPQLEQYSAMYGQRIAFSGAFFYYKAGPSLVVHRYAVHKVAPADGTGCPHYIYNKNFRPGINGEFGLAQTFNWFSIQVFVSGLLAQPEPSFQAGVRLAFGTFGSTD